MARMDKFEDLVVWQRSVDLSVAVHEAFAYCLDDYFKNTISQSSIKIACHIAEAFERGNFMEMIECLRNAKGSVAFLKTQLFIAEKTRKIEENSTQELIEICSGISKMIQNLIRSRENRETTVQ